MAITIRRGVTRRFIVSRRTFGGVNEQLLAVLLAVLGYSILNLTQAYQKIGLRIRETERLRGTLIWSAATASGFISVVLVYGAIALGSVSVVGALAGTGLVALAFFSALVMGETLRVRDGLAIGSIATGALLVGVFGGSQSGEGDVTLLAVLLAAGVTAGTLGWILTAKGNRRAVVVGGFAGFLGSYAQLFQNLSSQRMDLSQGVSAFLLATLTDPITLIWVSLSLSSMVVIQFAYRHGDAIQIIPVFTSLFILTPVLGGVLVFGEQLSVLQGAGVIVILAGTIILGRRGAAVEAA